QLAQSSPSTSSVQVSSSSFAIATLPIRSLLAPPTNPRSAQPPAPNCASVQPLLTQHTHPGFRRAPGEGADTESIDAPESSAYHHTVSGANGCGRERVWECRTCGGYTCGASLRGIGL